MHNCLLQRPCSVLACSALPAAARPAQAPPSSCSADAASSAARLSTSCAMVATKPAAPALCTFADTGSASECTAPELCMQACRANGLSHSQCYASADMLSTAILRPQIQEAPPCQRTATLLFPSLQLSFQRQFMS